jgi:oxidoreductase
MQVDQLGKSMRIAGERGTEDLPPTAEATETNWGSRNFTVIANRGAHALAQQDM